MSERTTPGQDGQGRQERQRKGQGGAREEPADMADTADTAGDPPAGPEEPGGTGAATEEPGTAEGPAGRVLFDKAGAGSVAAGEAGEAAEAGEAGPEGADIPGDRLSAEPPAERAERLTPSAPAASSAGPSGDPLASTKPAGEAVEAAVAPTVPAVSGLTGTAADLLVPVAPASRKRIRVLWLTQGLGLGGSERLLLSCARHADRSRYAIEVAYVLPWKDDFAADLESADVPVHRLVAKPEQRGRDPLWPVRLRSLVRERGYDLVHTHAPVPAVAARLLLRGESSVPLVHTEYDVWRRHRMPTRLANALTYGRNDAVIAVSQAVADSLGSLARRAAHDLVDGDWLSVVHHGPDLAGAPRNTDTEGAAGPPSRAAQGGQDGQAARERARVTLGVPKSAVVVGTVGNHTARKDQRTLLEAFALMLRNHPDATLLLIGSGPMEQRLREHSASLGLGGSVVFAGARTDVAELLPAMDVFALASRQEGLPVALMEAMASGLPSVATRVGGIPEIVDQGVEGLLVQPGDVEALSVALGRLVGGPALRARMAAAARERARRFHPGHAQRAVEALYERVLDARRGDRVPAAAASPQASHPGQVTGVSQAAPQIPRPARATRSGAATGADAGTDAGASSAGSGSEVRAAGTSGGASAPASDAQAAQATQATQGAQAAQGLP